MLVVDDHRLVFHALVKSEENIKRLLVRRSHVLNEFYYYITVGLITVAAKGTDVY